MGTGVSHAQPSEVVQGTNACSGIEETMDITDLAQFNKEFEIDPA